MAMFNSYVSLPEGTCIMMLCRCVDVTTVTTVSPSRPGESDAELLWTNTSFPSSASGRCANQRCLQTAAGIIPIICHSYVIVYQRVILPITIIAGL